MAELFMGRPIFPGNTETDQMFKIINVLGTPNVQQWPECAKLASKMNIRFPQVVPMPLESLMPNAPPSAINLMSEILRYDPARRPSAAQILNHPFFTGSDVSPMPRVAAPKVDNRMGSNRMEPGRMSGSQIDELLGLTSNNNRRDRGFDSSVKAVSKPPALEPSFGTMQSENRSTFAQSQAMGNSAYDKIIEGIAAQDSGRKDYKSTSLPPRGRVNKSVLDDDIMDDPQIGNEIDDILAGLL